TRPATVTPSPARSLGGDPPARKRRAIRRRELHRLESEAKLLLRIVAQFDFGPIRQHRRHHVRQANAEENRQARQSGEQSAQAEPDRWFFNGSIYAKRRAQASL